MNESEIKRVRKLGQEFKSECKRNDERHAAWDRRIQARMWAMNKRPHYFITGD